MTENTLIKPEQHALLSASASHRWLNCPGSVKLTESMPEKTSSYAQEGRLAHELGQLLLTKRYVGMPGDYFAGSLEAIRLSEYYAPEMERHVAAYVDFVEEVVLGFPKTPYVAIEQRVDYSRYAPSGFGTCDCLVVYDDVLHIIDLKYGQGVPVSAEDNPQMKLYALGAMERYRIFGSIRHVRMSIVQPRTDGTNSWEISADDLTAWGESIRETAQKAYDGTGGFKAGEWCRFCKAKAVCRVRKETNSALEDFGMKKPALLTLQEIGEALSRSRDLAAWVEDLEEYALNQCLSGAEIPGWKAVAGRANRQFGDVDKAFTAAINAGVTQELLYKRVPITLTELEKIMGKTDFAEKLGEFIVKPKGKPTLAKATDKRKAITNKTDAKSDFDI